MEDTMKALVTYFSQTGNTEEVARSIYDAITIEKEITPVQAGQNAKGYDIIFCGFPVHAHSVPVKVHSFIKDIPEGQNIAFFCTHGSLRGGQLPKQAIEQAVGLAAKAKVLGDFGCRGKVSPQILEALSKRPEHQAWAEEAQSADGHPDAADLADAKEFALQMIGKSTDLKLTMDSEDD
jgi:flavodoxin